MLKLSAIGNTENKNRLVYSGVIFMKIVQLPHKLLWSGWKINIAYFMRP